MIVRLELVGHLRRVVGGRDHVAAADVDLVGQGERDRLAGDGLLQVAVEGDDPRDGALTARGQTPHAVTRPHGAADDQAGEAAEIEVGAVDPLDGHPERGPLARSSSISTVSRYSTNGGPVYQGVLAAALGDVVALAARDRDHVDVVQAELPANAR